jgi:hypothetical protein
MLTVFLLLDYNAITLNTIDNKAKNVHFNKNGAGMDDRKST